MFYVPRGCLVYKYFYKLQELITINILYKETVRILANGCLGEIITLMG